MKLTQFWWIEAALILEKRVDLSKSKAVRFAYSFKYLVKIQSDLVNLQSFKSENKVLFSNCFLLPKYFLCFKKNK